MLGGKVILKNKLRIEKTIFCVTQKKSARSIKIGYWLNRQEKKSIGYRKTTQQRIGQKIINTSEIFLKQIGERIG